MNNQANWKREDGEPWESVESLPPPPSEVSSSTPEPYAWESLESLPAPFDAKQPSSAEPKEHPPEAKEGWSFRYLKEEESEGEEQPEEEEWIHTPLSLAPPRATTRPAVRHDVESVGDIEYMPFDHLSVPVQLLDRDPYPPYPAPSPWPYPWPLYPGPQGGAKRQGPMHRSHDHPPLTCLSTLVEQPGVFAPVRDPRRGRETQGPLSPLAPPPREPKREDIVIAEITYKVREKKVYAGDKEVVFSKTSTYLPVTARKARSPLRGRWEYEERNTHIHTRRRLPGNCDHPAARAIDLFWEENPCLCPRDKYQNLITKHTNNPRQFSATRNIGTLMRDWEDQGLMKISKRRKREREKEKSRIGRYAYHARSGHGKGKELSVGDEDGLGEENGVDEDKEQHDDRRAPEWTDEEEDTHRQIARRRLRRDFTDGHEIDDHNSIHYPPTSPQPFNVKHIRDMALKTLPNPRKKKHAAKANVPASAMDGEDAEVIFDTFSTGASPKPKKVDPYVSFKKTTGRHQRHFQKSKKRPEEVFQRLVLDRVPLADGREEPTLKNRRRTMIETVNLNIGERTRTKVSVYDRLPRMIRIAAGVEMMGGLPPWRRDVEEEDAGEEVEGTKTLRKKSSGGGKKNKDGCVVM